MGGMLRTCETPDCGVLTLGRFCLECEKKQAVAVTPDRRARLLETATRSFEAIEKTLEILIIERQRLHEQRANREPLEANRRAILYWQRELAQARWSSGLPS